MPILLDDLDLSAAVVAKAVDPKFFSTKLTGSGKKTGLLHENLRPVNTVTNTAYAVAQDIEAKQSSTQHDITTTSVPLAPITRRALLSGASSTLAIPHVDDRFLVDTSTSGHHDWDVMFDMTPQGLTLYEDKSGDRTKRDLVIQYRMELHFCRKDRVEPERAIVVPTIVGYGHLDATVVPQWDTSPMENARAFIQDLLHSTGLVGSNLDTLEEWMNDYSIYERITRLAQIWDSEAMADEICRYIADMPPAPTDHQLNMLAIQLRYLENYTVPLEAYRRIHQQLNQSFSGQHAATLSKQNLSLLMNHTLDQLDQMKAQLIVPARPAAPPALPAHLSKQQLDALTTHEPLVMTQAGAGTGKSTVILERINYLEACGVPAEDITVLSFTNAAADNITEKNPRVGSMTIAKMLIDIYSLNHPTHQVSAIDTIINSIDIFYPNNSFAAQFRVHLVEVDQNRTGAFTALNTFVEYHFDEVIALLDRIEQTSLELQIIICYQRIDDMYEPAHLQSKYLIIDEVQDNSVFEFIYVLKYVIKHAQALFIVGDASQTLYEFRSANPRALNTLERSGVFATFKLTTNYRSNQEILDFANVGLGGLETNQIANIQLRANSLIAPTADSFQDKVTLAYYGVPRLRGFVTQDLHSIIRNTVIPDYVDTCLDRGEQVAFLAYSRREVGVIEKTLEEVYPNRRVASLVSERVYVTDIFSKYIKCFWNDVLQVQPGNAAFVVSQGILDNLDALTKNAGSVEVAKAIRGTVSQWWTENSSVINGWLILCKQGTLHPTEFFERLRDNLLSFEITRNQQKLNVNKRNNQERKRKNLESKADLVVSTIHGAKGLEFDNVVVLYKEDTRMSQETKRMFYVAFTRAMNSEYILSYGTAKNAPIESSYQQLVTALAERDTRNAQRAQGIDPDLVADDDPESGPGSDRDHAASVA
ncbi:UvrD-helicase domain-containing protein [Amycolatopsis sp. CA-230715]|uniref:UvrD-helicase domain-containing protein n=1 Tax=Amycolatopsis sp. CA-230715 TaxID=2745196 RepID=UPI001C02E76C|nr:ATP-dependent helicase [Amycolatopsis sp. CA-230715]QWF85701.1 ATP-dependent DNA helicase Rep [Amycolatopsis sp. CA-230715]